MAEDNSAKITLATAIIGALGAIAAAIVPIYFNRPAPDPAPPAAKAEAEPRVEKPTKDPGTKGGGKADTRTAGSKDGPKSKGPTAHPPKGEGKSLPTDLARLQGKWTVVDQGRGTQATTKDDLVRTKTAWEFDGSKVSVRNHGDSPGLVYYQGSIKVHPDRSPRAFDFTGKNRQDTACEMLGIYSFEPPGLILRFRVYHVGEKSKPARPDSLKFEPDPKAGSVVRLRHVKD